MGEPVSQTRSQFPKCVSRMGDGFPQGKPTFLNGHSFCTRLIRANFDARVPASQPLEPPPAMDITRRGPGMFYNLFKYINFFGIDNMKLMLLFFTNLQLLH